MELSPTSDEKIMAALAHGSIFLMFFGPVIPVVVWATQRKKSKYVTFHALQAMGYQALIFWLWIVVAILIVLLTTCLAVPLGIFITENPRDTMAAPFVFQFFIFAFVFGALGLFFLTGITGAVFSLLGRDFRYPVIGKWLERYLPYHADSEPPIDETREDNWVAGVCHATAVLQIWGIVTPLLVWFTQKERSARLRFQAIQAAIYQGVALVAYIIWMILYIATFFGMFFIPLAAALMNRGSGGNIPTPVGIGMSVLFVIILIIWLLFFLAMPIYYLLAAFASIRVIQGRAFRYPILGGILEKRMRPPQNLETTP